jgi:hypothetical protein
MQEPNIAAISPGDPKGKQRTLGAKNMPLSLAFRYFISGPLNPRRATLLVLEPKLLLWGCSAE